MSFRRSALAILAACLLGAAAPVRRPAPAAPAEADDAILRALQDHLPSGWTVSPPEAQLGVPQVTVDIPDAWRGSPAAAAVSLCPDPDSDAWRDTPVLRLVVRYHGRTWPPYDCRP